MTFESDIVVSALLALEHQLVALRRHADELAAAFGNKRFGPAIQATENLRRGLDNLAATITSLKTHVVTFDREVAGHTVESLGELAIRAQTIVVAVQLSQLTQAFPRAARQANTQPWFVGRFRGVEDVATFLREEFARINFSWMQHRHDAQAAPADNAPAYQHRRARYRHAVRDAQQAVIALSRHPDLAHFLREGTARFDLPEVHTACAEISAVLNIRLDAEPDRRLFDAQPTTTPPAGPTKP